MKMKIIALTLAAATAFAFTPKQAFAGDNETALLGGLIGGIILGTVLADANVDTQVVFAGHGHHRDRHRANGYWQRVETRVWVPGYWVTERCHGYMQRSFVPGCYEFRTERVWVSYDRHHRRDYDRNYDRDYDRDYSRDYNRGHGRDRHHRRR